MFRKLSLFTAIIAFITILLNSYLRLTEAGLACADWPACYGQITGRLSPGLLEVWRQLLILSPQQIDWLLLAYQTSTALVAVLSVLMLLLSGFQKQARLFSVVSSVLLMALALALIAWEIWPAAWQAMPLMQTLQWFAGVMVFWGASGVCFRIRDGLCSRQTPQTSLHLLAWFGMLLLGLQVFWGGWVSNNFAATVCAGFPLCQGQWLPDTIDFATTFNIFQGLETGHISTLDYPAKIAALWLHRACALVLFIYLSVLMWRATHANNPKPLRRWGLLLSILLIIQITLGILMSVMPYTLPVIALAHSAFAALLMLPLIAISVYSAYEKPLPPAVETREAVEVTPVSPERVISPTTIEVEPENVLVRLKKQLQKTRSGLGGVLTQLAGRKIDEDALEEIEASLLMADVGIDVTQDILQHLTENLEKHQLEDSEALTQALKQYLYEILAPCSQPLQIPEQDRPFVILVVGVNGAGKTTTIGKLAKRLQNQGHSVMLAAGDTFRAAAVEQLETWGERNSIPVVAQHTGADSASVIFDAVQSAQAKGVDVLIADTAGRLHTKSNLMDELSKIKRIMAKLDEKAPHEVLLVLDAGTGQNALSQARLFNEAVTLTGIALTKLDGTAKGGVIFALARQIGVPIRFIGVGEGIDDLQDFDAKVFIDALFDQD
ncbi:signal recognition particle-docking protein FtsY [methane-oxidizing endosymbiont of Gigantopelta aegis]|uniref:signal recognition particle-docking protein FtsY n=1 Tax=methane-oxidizing endosymbiont of Gigantopelta aegis TaxID=2794938 RepID=UPI0018DEAE73|nr:signal recognition particle-docking protein FtsY [methane-oxidizing endosymbiont of Gigantopelta aegis]